MGIGENNENDISNKGGIHHGNLSGTLLTIIWTIFIGFCQYFILNFGTYCLTYLLKSFEE